MSELTVLGHVAAVAGPPVLLAALLFLLGRHACRSRQRRLSLIFLVFGGGWFAGASCYWHVDNIDAFAVHLLLRMLTVLGIVSALMGILGACGVNVWRYGGLDPADDALLEAKPEPPAEFTAQP